MKLEHRSGCIVCGAHIPTISGKHPDDGVYREQQTLRWSQEFDDSGILIISKGDLA